MGRAREYLREWQVAVIMLLAFTVAASAALLTLLC